MNRVRGFELVSEAQWAKDRTYLDMYLDSVKLPQRATSLSAGYDIFATHAISLEPHEEIKMPAGWKVYMPQNEFLMIVPRSSLGFKFYLRLANTTGIIDSDYYNNSGNEGHVWVKIRNEGSVTLFVSEGQAIAQAIFVPFLLADGDSFDGNVRVGGIGSSG